MISFQREIVYDFMGDCQELLKLHYQELTRNKEVVSLNPIWEKYAALEKAGLIALFTARDDGQLVGYSAFIVQPHLHYAETLIAQNDVLFLHPDYRKGMTGIKLIKYSERELKTQGVRKIVWHAKMDTVFRKILNRLGYVEEEVMAAKLL
ncbi:MAG: GNAT family N-acetyltransferase [Burkholderiaceae bacterium]|nr:GNAT family N-acetyltransferase [Burkholderiaceae bacterium]